MNRAFTFTLADLPKSFDPGPTNMSGRSADGTWRQTPLWQGKWEIWIEPAVAERSILDGTNLLSAWQQLYLAEEPAMPPLGRAFSRNGPDSAPEDEGPPLLR